MFENMADEAESTDFDALWIRANFRWNPSI